MKRIFLELDQKTDGIPTCVPKPCEVIKDCSKDIKATWRKIISADEIYFSSNFYTNGTSVVGSSEIFNLLMEKAAKECLLGKRVYSCMVDVNWQRIDRQLFSKVFGKGNTLFSKTKTGWVKISQYEQ